MPYAVLQSTEFAHLPDKTSVAGVALFRPSSLQFKPYNNGTSERAVFNLQTSSGALQCVSFKSSAKETLRGVSAPMVLHFSGKVNEFNETKNFAVDEVLALEAHEQGNYPASLFEERVYDVDSLRSFEQGIFANSPMTEAGHTILHMILDPLREKFEIEYAARAGGANHDNVVNGLFAHSLKCLNHLHYALPWYSSLTHRSDVDLLYIGTYTHDLGKVIEYSNGDMSPTGQLVSHRTLMAEYIAPLKSQIVDLKSEEWYYRLMSIYAQHHGEYEESPRTIESMIVHSIDNMEATLSSLDQKFKNHPVGKPQFTQGFFLA